MIDINKLSDKELHNYCNGLTRINKARMLFMKHVTICNELLAPIQLDHDALLRAEFEAIASIAQVLGVRDEDLMS